MKDLKRLKKKNRVGDFESDLITGKDYKGAFLTIVDRYSSRAPQMLSAKVDCSCIFTHKYNH